MKLLNIEKSLRYIKLLLQVSFCNASVIIVLTIELTQHIRGNLRNFFIVHYRIYQHQVFLLFRHFHIKIKLKLSKNTLLHQDYINCIMIFRLESKSKYIDSCICKWECSIMFAGKCSSYKFERLANVVQSLSYIPTFIVQVNFGQGSLLFSVYTWKFVNQNSFNNFLATKKSF